MQLTLNNLGLNCEDHCSTTQPKVGWIHIFNRTVDKQGSDCSYTWIFYFTFLTVWRVGTLNACAVQGSTGISLTGYVLRNESLELPVKSPHNVGKTVSSSNSVLQKCAPPPPTLTCFYAFVFFYHCIFYLVCFIRPHLVRTWPFLTKEKNTITDHFPIAWKTLAILV